MDCRRVRELLFEAPDSDVPEDVRKALEAHMSECRRCAHEASALDRELDGLRELPRVQAPPNLLLQIHERLEEPGAVRSTWEKCSAFFSSRRFMELAGVTAAAMLVIVLYHASLRELPEQRPAILPAPVQAPAPAPAIEPGPPRAKAPVQAPLKGEQALETAAGPGSMPERSVAPTAPAGAASGLAEPEPALKLSLTLHPSAETDGARLERSTRHPRRGEAEVAPRRAAPSDLRADESDRAAPALSASGRPEADAEKDQPSLQKDAPGLDASLARVYRIIKESAGEVIGTERRQGRALWEATVTAEIPRKNQGSLLVALRRLGEVRGADEGLSGGSAFDGRIRIVLTVTPIEP